MARKNKIEKNAPSALSTRNALLNITFDLPCNEGISLEAGSSLVPSMRRARLSGSRLFIQDVCHGVDAGHSPCNPPGCHDGS